MQVSKLNESFSIIDADDKPEKLQEIFNFLRVLRPGAYFDPMVKSGFKSPYDYYASIQNKKLLVMNGHLSLLGHFGIVSEELKSEYTELDLDKFLSQVKSVLPFAPHDFQERAFKESILNVKQINKMCTGSGKSMTISLIAEFFRRKGKKGLLLVPNINLLTQFKNDIKDYNLHELYNDTHTIGGGSTERHFNNSLTISTWQSMMTSKSSLGELNYVITDEAHRFASEETGDIVKSTVNCRYKWGFTGTLPEDPTMKMELFGLFGLPKTYVTSRELIDRGLATPIKINSVLFKYSEQDKKSFRATGNYAKQLQFIKDHAARNSFVVNLSCKLRDNGNTLVLFSHTSHGKLLFMEVMRKLYPGVEVQNKDITGKNSFGFQEKYGVYFLNGEDDAKTRERTRQILEDQHYSIELENGKYISLHEDELVILADGSEKMVKDLSENDDIDDNFLKKYLS
jgi:superfamily II DNA or RNA helicase